jgi:hypothetical protein
MKITLKNNRNHPPKQTITYKIRWEALIQVYLNQFLDLLEIIHT